MPSSADRIDSAAQGRRPECVERWPDCESGAYDPRCCRFPKSCSCNVRPEEIAARNLDLEKAQMQSVGSFLTIGLTLAQVVEVVTDLGIDLNEVEITNGIVTVKA